MRMCEAKASKKKNKSIMMVVDINILLSQISRSTRQDKTNKNSKDTTELNSTT